MKKAQTEHSQKLPTHNQIAWSLLEHYSPHSLNPKLTLDDIAKVTGLDDLTVKRLSQKLHVLRTLRTTADGLHYARMILTETDLDKPHYELD